MITKSAAELMGPQPQPQSTFSKVKAGAKKLFRFAPYGLDPITGAFAIADVASGKHSVGGTAMGVGAGVGAGMMAERGISKLTKAMGGSSWGKKLVSKLPAFAGKLPGWLGTGARIAGTIGASMAGDTYGKKVGNAVVPIWKRKKPLAYPGELTEDQMLLLRSTLRASTNAGINGELSPFVVPAGRSIIDAAQDFAQQ